jgi:hypothetical protein
MLQVTPEAKGELHGMLMRLFAERPDSDTPDLGFRLVAEGSQIGLALDTPREGDEIVDQDGHSVLMLDSLTSELVENLTLDVVETPDGARLELLRRE